MNELLNWLEEPLYYYLMIEDPIWYSFNNINLHIPAYKAIFASLFWSWFISTFLYTRLHTSPIMDYLACCGVGILTLPFWIRSPLMVNSGIPLGALMAVIVGVIAIVHIIAKPKSDLPPTVNVLFFAHLYGGCLLYTSSWWLAQ